MAEPQRIDGRRITVIGMARSGLAAAALARRHGGTPFVSDGGAADALSAPAAELERAGIAYETGGHTARALDADYVVTSPGVPPLAHVLVEARRAGLPVYSELEFASWVCRAPILAITGTNGKTTTAQLCGEMLSAAGREAAVCGNIGLPLSAVADRLADDAVAVVEVSSYQLETIDAFRPHVSVLLNLQPDHLDWHGSLEAYYAAKLRIAENQTQHDTFVYNADDAGIDPAAVRTGAQRLGFSIGRQRGAAAAYVADGWLCLLRSSGSHGGDDESWGQADIQGKRCLRGDAAGRIIPTSDIRIPGRHNLANAAAAALAVSRFGVTPQQTAEALRGFGGVEHRLEGVGDVGSVSFVNDSKATNVQSVCVALEAMDRPVHLIMGGRDKGTPYLPIGEAARGKVRRIVLIGEAAAVIERELGQALGEEIPISMAHTMGDAVRAAWSSAEPGDVVLLSPACSSFDMFDDFEARGRAFKEAVAGLQAERQASR